MMGSTALAQMRQDKMLDLQGSQFRWNHLPGLVLRYLDHQNDGFLAGSPVSTKTLSRCGL